MIKSKAELSECLSTRRFRANPSYDLVLYDRLPLEEQEPFAELQKDPNAYGILRPLESSGLTIKAVTQNTALLYLSLRDAGKLPSYARAVGGDNFERAIAKLVVDQILEIEDGEAFVSGAAAYGLFYETTAGGEVRTRIGQLSVSALRYGQALAINEIEDLSMRLYNYNRIPISKSWEDRFPSAESVADALGVQRLLTSDWQETASASKADVPAEEMDAASTGWLSWINRRVRATTRGGATYKLYISPLPEFIDEAFDVTANTLATTRAFHMKVGADVQGLLRPDKMVAYFFSRDDLSKAAEKLGKALDGCPAHGVPFTAELAGEGLLSWGVDPPESRQMLSWQPQESWRLWLTNRLANALLTAKRA
ncbi:MAG TPA: hypothetical protein VFR05_03935, partial [Terriglobia bacterium]|nr:hypothetical protein [Terriglobia bacterium]